MEQKSQPQRLSKEEINQLIHSYQTCGDKEAELTLVKNFENLVVSLARKYSKGREFHDDIVQVGMLGLLGAIRRFDASYGKNFESFAIPTILGEIKRYLRDKTWSVHVPRRIKEIGPKIKSAVDELTTTLQRSPKVEEIAQKIEVSEEEVLEAMEMGKSYQALSVDRSIEADSDGATITLLDLVGEAEKGYESVNQRLILQNALHVLTEREKQIISYTYLENLSQKDTGELLGISQMHVSRLQRKAIKKLRTAIKV
ncbi:RNA polymerase sigma factor SigB [Bacillus timonensis]|nr:RNA polymerase sigma factor SigB [Bacillus timonensis]